MTLEKNLQAIVETIRFYADDSNYQQGQPGEQTLLGWEPDNGRRAAAVLHLCDRLTQQIAAWQKPAEPAKTIQPFTPTDAHIDLWMRSWVMTQRIPLLASGWIGYTQKGRGIIVVSNSWLFDNPGLRFQMGTRYLSQAEIEAEISPPLRLELLNLSETYTPERQAVLLFGGHDLSVGDRRMRDQRFNREKIYWCVDVIATEQNETTTQMAEMLGLSQPNLNEPSIEVNNE